MSKLFNIPPNQVKVVFIISKELESNFMSFLSKLLPGQIKSNLDLVNKLEILGTLLIKEDDLRLEKLFDKLYEVAGVVYYYVGTKHLLKPELVDIFNKITYVKKDQWTDFNNVYKNMYGQTFEELLKEIK